MRKKEDFPVSWSEKEGRLSGKEVRKKEDFAGRRCEKEGRLFWKEE